MRHRPVVCELLTTAKFLQARMATSAVFEIANRHGDTIRSGWRNILDCVIRLHKLGLLPTRREQSQNGQGRPSDNQEGQRFAAAMILSLLYDIWQQPCFLSFLQDIT